MQQQQLELTASSPFSMVLEPIISDNGKVPLSGLQFLEEAIATTLFEEQPTGNIYLDMEAVIQQVDYFNDDDGSDAKQSETEAAITSESALPTRMLRIRFFVLATVVADGDESSSLTPRLELNQLIKTVLVDSVIGRNQFLQVLQSSNSTLGLQSVASVLVSPWSLAPTVPSPSNGNPPPTSSSNSRRLSTLDIVLIAASGLIFAGIMYMIVQHHYDRGYIENQRVLAFNRRVEGENDDDHATHHSHPRSPRADKRGPSDDSGSSRTPGLSHGATNTTLDATTSEEAPSTPSTLYSTNDLQPHHPQGDLRTPERRTPRITNVDKLKTPPSSPISSAVSAPGILNSHAVSCNALLMTPKALLSASSLDGASIQSISESFDGQWFQTNVIDVDKVEDFEDACKASTTVGGDDGHVGKAPVTVNGDQTPSQSDDGGKDTEEDILDAEEDDDDDSSSEDSTTSESSESSEDVFGVDVEAASAADKSKASSSHASNAAAISEWMKTIQVVSVVQNSNPHNNGLYSSVSGSGQNHSSSDTKTSDMTHSSYGEAMSSSVSSSPPRDAVNGENKVGATSSSSPIGSRTHNSLDVAELEHLSLEQSMASSNIVPDDLTKVAVLEV